MDGKATLDNGANVCRRCHDWLEQLSELEREKVNEELREYKRNFFTIGAIEITTDGIQQAKKIDFKETEEYISIPAYDITPEEYQKYIEQRRKRELNKPKWKGKEYEDR